MQSQLPKKQSKLYFNIKRNYVWSKLLHFLSMQQLSTDSLMFYDILNDNAKCIRNPVPQLSTEFLFLKIVYKKRIIIQDIHVHTHKGNDEWNRIVVMECTYGNTKK